MSTDWTPSALNIQPEIATTLSSGGIHIGPRFSGKTETLLAYIALHHQDAIVVSELSRDAANVRAAWSNRYPALRQPRFISTNQLISRASSFIGTVFSDECSEVAELNIFCQRLRYGGGVSS